MVLCMAVLNTGATPSLQVSQAPSKPSFTPTRVDPRVAQVLAFAAKYKQWPAGYLRSDEPLLLPQVPTVVRFAEAPDASFRKAVHLAGGHFGAGGQALLAGGYSVHLSAQALALVEADKNVTHVELDLARSRPAPMNRAQVETGAAALRRAVLAKNGALLDGTGVLIADIDSGVMPLLPSMRRADGGVYSWNDGNNNGRFDAGVDCIELNEEPGCQDGETLKLYEYDAKAITTGPYGPYLQDTRDALSVMGRFEPDVDYVFVDTNGNGQFDMGIGDGDDIDSLSEPIFMADDLNQDGGLGASERLLRLGTSKVKRVYARGGPYGEGKQKSLVGYAKTLKAGAQNAAVHGMGVTHELVAGVIGRSRLAGLVPGAALLAIDSHAQLGTIEMLQILADEKPNIVLTEYAPYVNYPLDGSTEEEQTFDALHDAGTVMVKPAGNLGTGERHWSHTVGAGVNAIALVPLGGRAVSRFIYITVLHAESSGGAVPPGVVIRRANGQSVAVPVNSEDAPVSGAGVEGFASSLVSTRGTRHTTIAVRQNDGRAFPSERLTFELSYPVGTPTMQAHAYFSDENSWSGSMQFEQHRSSASTICHPATSDKGLRMGAYALRTTYADEQRGQLEGYSSRGPRLFFPGTISIAAPANPLVVGFEGPDSASVLNGANYSYFLFGGTSGSSPMAVGAAALLKQLNPAATADEIESAIVARARKEPGTTDNVDDWGAGKLDVYAAAGITVGTSAAPTVSLVQEGAIYIGVPATLKAVAKDDNPGVKLRWDMNYDGIWDTEFLDADVATTQVIQRDKPGVQYVRVEALDRDGNLSGASTVVVFSEAAPPVVVPLPVAPSAGAQALLPGGSVAGGGASGCSLSSGDDSLALGIVVFLALGGASRRRRNLADAAAGGPR